MQKQYAPTPRDILLMDKLLYVPRRLAQWAGVRVVLIEQVFEELVVYT